MAFERVFTEEELRTGGLRSVDALEEALAKGDREGATGYLKRLRREILSMIGELQRVGDDTSRLGDRNVPDADAATVLSVIEDDQVAPDARRRRKRPR